MFTPLKKDEIKKMSDALVHNAESDTAILMDPVDTTFLGESKDVEDDDVIFAIKSVPVHY